MNCRHGNEYSVLIPTSSLVPLASVWIGWELKSPSDRRRIVTGLEMSRLEGISLKVNGCDAVNSRFPGESLDPPKF